MSENTTPLILKDFGGSLEITPAAQALKSKALATSKPILKVQNPEEQSLAVVALRMHKDIRIGIESSRKDVTAPVTKLKREIDNTAADFVAEVVKEEHRLQGLISHYQNQQLELQRKEEERIRREQQEAQRIEDEARRKREEAERTKDDQAQRELIRAATDLESEALDKKLSAELSDVPLVDKPKGLVVRNRLNIQIEDAFVFVQAYPQFFSWNPATETLKLKRREILEELNREDGKGIFHMTHFPEELPDQKDSRICKPPGARVFEETKSHVR